MALLLQKRCAKRCRLTCAQHQARQTSTIEDTDFTAPPKDTFGSKPAHMKEHKMDYNSLRIFVACAQKGSFSSAAKHLGMALPTVSRKMAELERDLSTQLFDRSTRGCVVTVAGARLWDTIGASIEVLNGLEHIGQLDSAKLSGRLRLSMPQSFWPWWELLGEFQRLHPDIEVSVYSTERRVDRSL